MLHHIWQHRRREWPIQEISDGADLARLAARHPKVIFILAHIGGGGDYAHTFHALKDSPNIYPDLSGSGVDRGMLDDAIKALGAQRLLWGSDITMCTGLAKLRALETTGLLSADDMKDIRWRNAARIFPPALSGVVPAADAAHDRRQRADRARIRSGPCRIRIRTCSCACSIARRSSGAWVGSSAVGVSSRSDGGKRRAVRGAQAACARG